MTAKPCLCSTSCIATFLLRVTFGLGTIFIGIAHYLTFSVFKEMTSAGLGPISFLGTAWAFILPALLILGGALLFVGVCPNIATRLIGIGFGSIVAGMLLKSVLSNAPLGDTLPASTSALIWLVVFFLLAQRDWSMCARTPENEEVRKPVPMPTHHHPLEL